MKTPTLRRINRVEPKREIKTLENTIPSIVKAEARHKDPLPYTVEAWNSESCERDEAIERKFRTLDDAKKYAFNLSQGERVELFSEAGAHIKWLTPKRP